MNRIQKFDTFLKEIHATHTNKSLIEGVIGAFSAIFEADLVDEKKEDEELPDEAGNSGLLAYNDTDSTKEDVKKRTNTGVYGNKRMKMVKGGDTGTGSGGKGLYWGDRAKVGAGGKADISKGSSTSNFGWFGDNKKVNELGDKELQAFEFNENSFEGMSAELVTGLKSLIQKQKLRPQAFDRKQLRDIGTCCYKIINSGNQGMVNSEKATKNYINKNKGSGLNIVIENQDDVAKVIDYLNAELMPSYAKSEVGKSDDELIDPIQDAIKPVLELLNVSADAAYKEVEKVSVAMNDEYKQHRSGGLTDQEARTKGLDLGIVNERNPYYTQKLKYSKKLQNKGANRVGANTRAIIIELLKEAKQELGDSKDNEAVKEILKAFYNIKSKIDSPITHMMFKNAGKISKDVGTLYGRIPNTPIKWEELYEGSGKQQSLITHFRAFNAGAYTKIPDALNKYETLISRKNKEGNPVDEKGNPVKIPDSIFKIPTKFIKLIFSLKHSGMSSADTQKWLREQTKYIVDNSNVDPKVITDMFNQKKAEVLAQIKDDSILSDLAESITYDASSYEKLMAQNSESDVA